MRTILIMLSALGAAILVLNLLKNWQRRRAEQRGETVISVVAGLTVFFIGALWLESSSAPPGSIYAPATIEGGTLKSGGFETQK